VHWVIHLASRPSGKVFWSHEPVAASWRTVSFPLASLTSRAAAAAGSVCQDAEAARMDKVVGCKGAGGAYHSGASPRHTVAA
jgi:hypothetical protein